MSSAVLPPPRTIILEVQQHGQRPFRADFSEIQYPALFADSNMRPGETRLYTLPAPLSPPRYTAGEQVRLWLHRLSSILRLPYWHRRAHDQGVCARFALQDGAIQVVSLLDTALRRRYHL